MNDQERKKFEKEVNDFLDKNPGIHFFGEVWDNLHVILHASGKERKDIAKKCFDDFHALKNGKAEPIDQTEEINEKVASVLNSEDIEAEAASKLESFSEFDKEHLRKAEGTDLAKNFKMYLGKLENFVMGSKNGEQISKDEARKAMDELERIRKEIEEEIERLRIQDQNLEQQETLSSSEIDSDLDSELEVEPTERSDKGDVTTTASSQTQRTQNNDKTQTQAQTKKQTQTQTKTQASKRTEKDEKAEKSRSDYPPEGLDAKLISKEEWEAFYALLNDQNFAQHVINRQNGKIKPEEEVEKFRELCKNGWGPKKRALTFDDDRIEPIYAYALKTFGEIQQEKAQQKEANIGVEYKDNAFMNAKYINTMCEKLVKNLNANHYSVESIAEIEAAYTFLLHCKNHFEPYSQGVLDAIDSFGEIVKGAEDTYQRKMDICNNPEEIGKIKEEAEKHRLVNAEAIKELGKTLKDAAIKILSIPATLIVLPFSAVVAIARKCKGFGPWIKQGIENIKAKNIPSPRKVMSDLKNAINRGIKTKLLRGHADILTKETEYYQEKAQALYDSMSQRQKNEFDQMSGEIREAMSKYGADFDKVQKALEDCKTKYSDEDLRKLAEYRQLINVNLQGEAKYHAEAQKVAVLNQSTVEDMRETFNESVGDAFKSFSLISGRTEIDDNIKDKMIEFEVANGGTIQVICNSLAGRDTEAYFISPEGERERINLDESGDCPNYARFFSDKYNDPSATFEDCVKSPDFDWSVLEKMRFAHLKVWELEKFTNKDIQQLKEFAVRPLEDLTIENDGIRFTSVTGQEAGGNDSAGTTGQVIDDNDLEK